MKKAFIFIVILFLLNVVSITIEIKTSISIPYIYSLFHILGGFGVSMFFIDYFRKTVFDSSLSKYICILGATALIGVLWEFSEFIASQTLVEPLYTLTKINFYFMGDLADTMKDLLLDLIGGSIAYFTLKR